MRTRTRKRKIMRKSRSKTRSESSISAKGESLSCLLYYWVKTLGGNPIPFNFLIFLSYWLGCRMIRDKETEWIWWLGNQGL